MRTAIVTGATGGIGRAICRSLINDGFIVAAIYTSDEQTAAELRAELGASTFKCDVSKPDECIATIAVIEATLGPVDTLVNNAGVCRDAPYHLMKDQDWDTVLSTNLTGMHNMTRPLWTSMREARFGRVVNISSINGLKGQFGQVNYSASKAGVLGFTKALALEGARRGITVNAIAPGYIDTKMLQDIKPEIMEGIVSSIPVGRLGKPSDIADLVSYLVKENTSYITGETISINGGQHID